MQEWIVPSHLDSAFNEIRSTHRLNSLPVFDATGTLVPPTELAERLPGALVQLNFVLKHWYFEKDNRTNIFDSYSARLKQIIILEEAPPALPDPYAGLFRPLQLPIEDEP
jgi:hypothetical protein